MRHTHSHAKRHTPHVLPLYPYPYSLLRSGKGMYYHTAYYNNAANQLTELVPLDRMIAQISAYVGASKNTTVFVDNVSDLRPAPMTSGERTRSDGVTGNHRLRTRSNFLNLHKANIAISPLLTFIHSRLSPRCGV